MTLFHWTWLTEGAYAWNGGLVVCQAPGMLGQVLAKLKRDWA